MKTLPKILVTGANGQLGKELKDRCSLYAGFEFVFLSKEDFPIHHFELARNFFKTIEPAYCINCAAYTAVDKAEEEKDLAFQVNGEAVGVLAAICKEYQTRFIHISTDYVFDGRSDVPYKEDFPANPLNVYGASKLEGEKQALQLNADTIILRTSWVYSPYGNNFVKTMMKLMVEKNEICVVNDQVGSPTYAGDLAEAIMSIISNRHPDSNRAAIDNQTAGVYHFSNDGVISWYEFATAIKNIMGSECVLQPVSTSEFPTVATRPAFSVMDKTKIQESFSIKLKDWTESLRSCIEKIKKAS